MLEVYSEILKYINTEKGVRHLECANGPELMIKIAEFVTGNVFIDDYLMKEFQKSYKMWIETYFSMFADVDKLF